MLIECNAWALPQERYNAEWVEGKRVGIVLKSFRELVAGVRERVEPARLQEFRKNVEAIENSAIFEIPEILARLMGEPAVHPQASGQETSKFGVPLKA